MHNIGVLVQSDLLLLGRGLPWVLGLEDLVELLKSLVLGLGAVEVDGASLDETPDAEDDVGAPSDLLKGYL